MPSLAGLRTARAQQEAALRCVRVFGPVLFFGYFLLAAFRARPVPAAAGPGLVETIAVSGFAAGCAVISLTRRRRTNARAAVVIVMVGSAAALMCVQPSGPGVAGAYLGVLLLARRLPWRPAMWLSAAALVVLAVVSLVGSDGHANVPLLVVLGCLSGMILLTDRLVEANRQAEQLVAELERGRGTDAEAAGLAERQRLAREMHDVLAHSLSGLMLQLEGARMLALGDPGDSRLPEAIDRAHHLAKTGLEEARRAIGMLRDDELPGPDRLAGLAAQFEHDRGIPCRLIVTGVEHPLSSEARLALYRVTQEALTNITKHARPDRVELHLAYQPFVTRLVVEDFTAPGRTRPASASAGGYGLTGMRERAELLGGTLTAKTTPTGFRVELEVPA
jgi:signal transduction histidine kinase